MAEHSQLQYIWKQVSERVQNLISPISYNTYIKTLEPIDIMGRILVLKAETPLGANTIMKKHAEKIRDAVCAAPGYDPAALPICIYDDFRETVLAASAAASEGDTVILSPACSSFDRFKNFAERGNTFRKIVEELK